MTVKRSAGAEDPLVECSIELSAAKRSRNLDSPCAVPSHSLCLEDDLRMEEGGTPTHHERHPAYHADVAEAGSSCFPSGSPQSVQNFLQRLIRDRHFASVQNSLSEAHLNAQVW